MIYIIMTMCDNLIGFLNEFRIIDENIKPTHQSWGKIIQGSFNINKSNIKKFVNLYSSVINNTHLSILEIQKEYSSILIDIDLKQSIDNNKRLYNKKDIIKLIKIYNYVINYFLDMNTINYNFFVFEKPSYITKDNIIKDGFHIMIPEICSTTNVRHMIRKRVVDICCEDKLFSNNLDSVDKIIDKSVVSSNGWFLYGSFKPGGLPYKLTKIYNNKYEELDLSIDDNDLIKYLSIHYKKNKYSEKNANQIKNNITSITNNEINNENDINNDNEINNILEHLDKNRFNNYDEWLILYFIFINENYDLDLFDTYSSTCNNYNKKNKIINKY